jgi:hypothetical protein
MGLAIFMPIYTTGLDVILDKIILPVNDIILDGLDSYVKRYLTTSQSSGG